QPAKFTKPLKEKGARRNFPIKVEMRHRSRRPNHIDRTIPGNLVSDAHVVAARVLCFRQHKAQPSDPPLFVASEKLLSSPCRALALARRRLIRHSFVIRPSSFVIFRFSVLT